ncbi:hypothetical protein AYI68_g6515, partial [Smittium mucronatum]
PNCGLLLLSEYVSSCAAADAAKDSSDAESAKEFLDAADANSAQDSAADISATNDSLVSAETKHNIGKTAHGLSAIRYLITSGTPLPLRAPELFELGFSNSMISSKMAADLVSKLVHAAGCPYPHTAMAIDSTISAMYEFPGPSRLNPWLDEINAYFNEFDDLMVQFSSVEEMGALEAKVGGGSGGWFGAISSLLHL